MVRVNLAQAQAQPSELLDQVEAGEEILITQDGRPVAQISAVKAAPQPKKPIDVEQLKAFLASQPPSQNSFVDSLRQLRDEERF